MLSVANFMMVVRMDSIYFEWSRRSSQDALSDSAVGSVSIGCG